MLFIDQNQYLSSYLEELNTYQPSMHLVQIPDIGTTFLDRLNVPVASLAFGLLRFILDTSDYKYADCLAYSLKKIKFIGAQTNTLSGLSILDLTGSKLLFAASFSDRCIS
jgi:hypothetical protein